MKTEFSGILLIKKPQGKTSHDMVYKVRRLYNTREVGHTGTLDPLATGLLVVLVGRAVKACDMIVSDSKVYRAGLKLGLTTDTEDTTGEVLSRSDAIPSREEAMAVFESFVGKIKQVPPMYSALKVDGQKLVDLARRGKVVEREAREVEITSLVATPTDRDTDYILEVACSKGTYIRTLCADIGAKLGCGGVMYSLERVKSGIFSLDNAHTIEEIEAMSEEERLSLLHPVEGVFDDLAILRMPAFYQKLAKNGCEIYQKKIRTSYPVGTRLRLYDDNGFYGIGEVRDYPDGSAVKCIKFFALG